MPTRKELRAEIERLRSKISLPPWAKAKTFEGVRYRGDILSACKGHPQKPVAQMLGQQNYDERVANADLVCLLVSNLDTILAALSISDPDRDAVAAARAETRDDERLDARLKAAGMFTVAEMMAETPLTRWTVHTGVQDLESFGQWLDMKVAEYLRMKAHYALGDKNEADELYEWTIAHSAAFSTIRTNFRAALERSRRAFAPQEGTS